jgi:uncharacterized protein YraI
MKRIVPAAALGFSLFAITPAFAADGYVTGNVNLRAGPDSSYPSVARLRGGTPVSIQGCVDGWSWCDVAVGSDRGWVAGNFLQEEYQGQRVLVPAYGVQIGIPIVSFVFGSYWDDHYQSRSWYHERNRWSQVSPHYRPVAAYGGSYGNAHPHSPGYSQSTVHTTSHAPYAQGHASHNDMNHSNAVAHSSMQARPAHASEPQHAVAQGAPMHDAGMSKSHNPPPKTYVAKSSNRGSRSTSAERKASNEAGAHRQAPKSEHRDEGDKDKEQR